MRPWRAAHIIPSGEFIPCCFTSWSLHNKEMSNELNSPETKKQINVSQNNLFDARNHPVWKKLRSDLINGIENPICNACWDLEKNIGGSHRIQTNYEHASVVESIEFHEDGTLDSPEVTYWDIRDTNLCNMKCIMCSPGYSSLYQQESIENSQKFKGRYFMSPTPDRNGEIHNVIDIGDYGKEQVRSRLAADVAKVKEMYFAGGEPLINSLHYELLDSLISAGRRDCRLTYNSNLLKLNHFGKDTLNDYWKHFDRIVLRASIDSTGKRAEWSRYGTNWASINKNVKRITDFIHAGNNNINMGLNVTLSMYTIAGLRELIEWSEECNFNGHVTVTNFLQSPKFYQINVLPLEYRQQLMSELDEFINKLDAPRRWRYTSSGKTNTATSWPDQWIILKNVMNSPEPDNVVELRAQAKKYITTLDTIRNTSILEACPEFQNFWHSW